MPRKNTGTRLNAATRTAHPYADEGPLKGGEIYSDLPGLRLLNPGVNYSGQINQLIFDNLNPPAKWRASQFTSQGLFERTSAGLIAGQLQSGKCPYAFDWLWIQIVPNGTTPVILSGEAWIQLKLNSIQYCLVALQTGQFDQTFTSGLTQSRSVFGGSGQLIRCKFDEITLGAVDNTALGGPGFYITQLIAGIDPATLNIDVVGP